VLDPGEDHGARALTPLNLGGAGRVPGAYWGLEGLWRSPVKRRALLPVATDLPDGALLQVLSGQWCVETRAGWQAIGGLGLAGTLPDATALPDGALLQVLSGQWCVETAHGWVPTADMTPATALPDPMTLADGTLLQVHNGLWEAV
jgi:hypothetical protein